MILNLLSESIHCLVRSWLLCGNNLLPNRPSSNLIQLSIVSVMVDPYGNPIVFLREKRTAVHPYPQRAMMFTGYYRPVRRSNHGGQATGVFAQGNAVSGEAFFGGMQPPHLNNGPEPIEESEVSSAEAQAAPEVDEAYNEDEQHQVQQEDDYQRNEHPQQDEHRPHDEANRPQADDQHREEDEQHQHKQQSIPQVLFKIFPSKRSSITANIQKRKFQINNRIIMQENKTFKIFKIFLKTIERSIAIEHSECLTKVWKKKFQINNRTITQENKTFKIFFSFLPNIL